jgi:hypothetical protein
MPLAGRREQPFDVLPFIQIKPAFQRSYRESEPERGSARLLEC